MDPKATAILQAIAQATQKTLHKADQINSQAEQLMCPTCHQPVPPNAKTGMPTSQDASDTQDSANTGNGL